MEDASADAMRPANSRYLSMVCRKQPDGSPGDICGPELPFADVAKSAAALGDMCKNMQCCTYSEIEGWKPNSAYAHVHDQYHCLFDVDGRCARPHRGSTGSAQRSCPRRAPYAAPHP